MFVYAKNMQLALSDKLRRAGLAAGAGVVLILGAGFLLAALWTWLAYHLGWGSLGASLAIGILMVVIGVIFLMMAKHERHPVPSTDELKLEVQQQLHLAADTALAKASDAADQAVDRAASKANELLDTAESKAHALFDTAEHKVHSVADNLAYRANRFADQAEARVYGTARGVGEATAQRLGFASRPSPGAAGQGGDDASPSRAAPFAPVLGALAIGITLANRLQHRRHRDDDRHYRG